MNRHDLKEAIMAIPDREWFERRVATLFEKADCEVLISCSHADYDEATGSFIYPINNLATNRKDAIELLFDSDEGNPVKLLHSDERVYLCFFGGN